MTDSNGAKPRRAPRCQSSEKEVPKEGSQESSSMRASPAEYGLPEVGQIDWPEQPRLNSVGTDSSFLSLSEVAAELRIDRTTAYRLAMRGDFAVHRVGRQLRVLHEDFAAYLARIRTPSNTEHPAPQKKLVSQAPIRIVTAGDDEARGLELARKRGSTRR